MHRMLLSVVVAVLGTGCGGAATDDAIDLPSEEVGTTASGLAEPHPPAASDAKLICPYWDVNSDFHAVHSCYDRVHDNFWVYDGRADGYSAVVKWHTDTGGSGECRNSNGYGTWVRCNYGLREYKDNGTRNYVHWQEWRYDADEWGWQLISGTWDSPT
jgi:hypothetical protein